MPQYRVTHNPTGETFNVEAEDDLEAIDTIFVEHEDFDIDDLSAELADPNEEGQDDDTESEDEDEAALAA